MLKVPVPVPIEDSMPVEVSSKVRRSLPGGPPPVSAIK